MGLAVAAAVVSPELNTPGLEPVVAMARRVAGIPAAVLIVAEDGSPVEALARLIHFGPSGDPRGGWVGVQTSGRPEALIEAELFGSPDLRWPSAIDRASGGTLFIDSVQHLTPSIQVRLSAILLGDPASGGQAIPRVIAATTVDLNTEVKQRRFRSDLLERLSAITIAIPPLRKRPADIIPLATMFARAEAQQLGRPFKGFSAGAEAKLSYHTYPGNEEELRRTLNRAATATTGATIGAAAIEFDSPTELVADIFVQDAARSSDRTKGRVPTLSEIERAYVIWVLRYTNLNRTAAARLLGISYPTIAKKISDYHIDLASLGDRVPT